MSKEIVLGLIKGRHPLPVENYIVEETELNVFTRNKLEPIIKKGLKKLGIPEYFEFERLDYDEIESVIVDENNNEVNAEDIPLVKLYITGLTIVTLTALDILHLWGYDVEIMGYNPNTQEYYSQGIFSKIR